MTINDTAALNAVTSLLGEQRDMPLRTPLPRKRRTVNIARLFGAPPRAPTELPAPMEQVAPEPMPIPKMKPPMQPEAEMLGAPFWLRALQVFAAPFEWVDENIIKPGLALGATTIGAIREVKRLPGEDYWEWKKRSWGEWKAPGININVPWSDEDLRLDIRGVMELAPWLLIPGAGQVGGAAGLGARIAGKAGVRIARGIAGKLGTKLGLPGRVLGTAIEYSPWGMVEKAAGRGIGAIGKVTGRVGEKVGERIVGKMPEPIPPAPVVAKLTKFFEETVIPARKAFKEVLPEEVTAKQYAVIDKYLSMARRGEITHAKAVESAQKAMGKIPGVKAQFAVKPGQFTKNEMEELLGIINKSAENEFVKLDSAKALRDLLMKGELPQPHHIRDFTKVFGEDFAKAVNKLIKLPRSKWEGILDAFNLPRAVLASGDLSATFRQGLILLLTHPEKAPRAFARQLKALASEKISLEMDDLLRTRPLYRNAVNDGVEFTAIRRGAAMVAKEEPFFSNMAQRLPMVRRSERAFTTFLNEMRMSAYEAAHGAMTAQGATQAQFKLLGGFINMASGRGTLPANLNRYAPILNTVLFSARYQMSTLQLPRQLGRMLLSGNPYMRKEAAKALITFVGGGSALLGLLKITGRGKVEIDPRSGDFGKVIIGKTRLDIWRGYVQYARFVAQLLAGERKSAYGNMNKVQRSEITSRFLQSKASPAFGLFVDLLKGESYMGEPLFNETTGFIKTAKDRLLPLALQDVIDAMEQSGVNGLWTAVPATLGVGVLTYVNDLVRVKEKIARDMGYKTWDELDPKTQREVQNRNVELQTAYIDFDRQVMGTAWGDWRNAGKAIEDTFRENTQLAVSQYRTSTDPKKGITFREKISDAFTARRGGYAAREKETRFEDIVRRLNVEDTAESLIELGPEQMAIRVYNEALYGDDMYDEFDDYRFDEADRRKKQLRNQLGDDMFRYVEEYRGLKYEDLPREFHLLTEAKRVLRPYWRIEKQVIAEKGTPKNEKERRAIDREIAKRRKALREKNPQIAHYYNLFYSSKGAQMVPTFLRGKVNIARLFG